MVVLIVVAAAVVTAVAVAVVAAAVIVVVVVVVVVVVIVVVVVVLLASAFTSASTSPSTSTTVDGQNLAPPVHAYFKRLKQQAPNPLSDIGSYDYLSSLCKISATGTNPARSLSQPKFKTGCGEPSKDFSDKWCKILFIHSSTSRRGNSGGCGSGSSTCGSSRRRSCSCSRSRRQY